ncbi:MAG: hypothetical protein COA90_00100 [Gammaproteobacteria bacterium]|nr:MAG: hypothetical protein COA90_00100 [Gammaproteobacteria bacterium]
MKFINLLLLSLLLSCSGLSLAEGKIYRFTDKEGVSTLSKTLPSYASQQGYDILDDQSLRVIERISTREEQIDFLQKQEILKQKQLQAEQEKLQQRQHAKQQRQQRRTQDLSLLAQYPTAEILTESRDEDSQYRQKNIEDLSRQLTQSRQQLRDLQNQAAELEISGEVVSTALQHKLTATKQDIEHNIQLLQQSKQDKTFAQQHFNDELIRLERLLNSTKTE